MKTLGLTNVGFIEHFIILFTISKIIFNIWLYLLRGISNNRRFKETEDALINSIDEGNITVAKQVVIFIA